MNLSTNLLGSVHDRANEYAVAEVRSQRTVHETTVDCAVAKSKGVRNIPLRKLGSDVSSFVGQLVLQLQQGIPLIRKGTLHRNLNRKTAIFRRALKREISILRLHDLLPLSPSQTPFLFCSLTSAICDPKRLIGWGCPGSHMVNLSERKNGVWGRERGDRANPEYKLEICIM